MKSYKLGLTHTILFDNYLVIGFDKRWISLNKNDPIEFSVKVKNGKLILSGNLASLDRTKGVDSNAM